MPQKITPNQTENCYSFMNEKKRSRISPSPRSLAFILQFAHSYHVEKKLPSSLAGMVLN